MCESSYKVGHLKEIKGLGKTWPVIYNIFFPLQDGKRRAKEGGHQKTMFVTLPSLREREREERKLLYSPHS